MDLIKAITNKDQEWMFGLILSFDESNPLTSIKFFESEVLSSLKAKKNITLVISRNSLRSITAKSSEIHYAGVYYNIQAVDVIGGGVFHPKLYLMVAEQAIHLVLGSCNLTRSGLKRNVESFIEIKINEENLSTSDRFFISDIKNFLTESFLNENSLLSGISLGLKNTIKKILECNIFRAGDSQITKIDKKRDIYFLSSIQHSLKSQIFRIINEPIKQIEIVSPFYDKHLSSFKQITSICRDVKVYIPKKRNTFPIMAFSENEQVWKQFKFYSISCSEFGINRFIHAKLYRFTTSNGNWSLITSANFTSPGFFGGESSENNKKNMKNFETGILYNNNSYNDLYIKNQFDIQHIKTPSQLQSQSERKSDDLVSKDLNKTIDYISSALYDGKDIIIEHKLSEQINPICIELFIKQKLIKEFVLKFNSNTTSICPPMEIDNHDSIRIRIKSKQTPNLNDFIIVSREHHEYNNLPSLSSNAFERCISIGGEEGLDEAFKLAKASGRKDWLFYLLSHWSLYKIYAGKKGLEENPNSGIMEIPTFRNGKYQSYKLSVLQDNVDNFQNNKKLWKNINSFCEQIDKSDESKPEIIDMYTKYCLPIFTEIAFHYNMKLKRESKKKLKNPQIINPQYKWLEYYKRYSPLANLMYDKVFHLVKIASSSKNKGTTINPDFWIWILVFFKLPSKKTLNKILQRNIDLQKDYTKVFKYTKEAGEKVCYQSGADKIIEYEKIFHHFKLKFNFD